MIWETGNLSREKDQIWNPWKVKKIKSKGEKGMNENKYTGNSGGKLEIGYRKMGTIKIIKKLGKLGNGCKER